MSFDSLLRQFEARFPALGSPRLCRAPGRVNLIGEHLDYNGLPVLPVAMGEEVRIAFAPNPGRDVILANADPAYEEARFESGRDIAASPEGAWENYAKAAVQGINRALGTDECPGAVMLVDATLPSNAGLSSSSALVVACAMAYLGVLENTRSIPFDRISLAELLAEAEHYVGTQGGGMDQAAILCGKQGHAVKVDFFPLRVERVPLPEGVAIVVCDSLVQAKKTGDALWKYNAGPAACRLATALVRKQIEMDFGEGIDVRRIGDLWHGHLCMTHREAHDLCMEAVGGERTTLAEAGKRLGMSEAAVRKAFLGPVPEPEGGFPLRARLRHVMTEFQRVETARDALLASDVDALGELLNDSHASCAEDYAISCPELDALADACRASGALGARLTGAGFGGSVVSLVPEEGLPSFIEAIQGRFYAGNAGASGRKPWLIVDVSDGATYI